jgi:predicted TIM-barrel fold metal-dependent hydrolase
MSNPKTVRCPPKPESQNGWVHKCDLDDYLDRHLPIPTQVVSNEEYFPLPQTWKQKAVEHRLLEIATRNTKNLGIDRREFLHSSCGMAAAFTAMNAVFGDFFRVDAAEMLEPAAAAERKVDYFIFDVQTHHVALDRWKLFGVNLLDFRRTGRTWNSELRKREPKPEDLYMENYIKEVFLDSDTDVAALSGIPALTDDVNILPPDQMVRTRGWVNQLTHSRRMISHGLISPDLGTQNKERMQVQAEKLKIDAWKGYTGQGLGADKEGWWLDDENVTYPTLEYSRRLNVKNICVHKGLASGLFNEEHCNPRDVVKVSKDFPDLNFLLYHSGFKSLEAALPAAQDGFRKSSYVPWVSDLCEWRKKNPHMKNVYMELGSTFGMMAITQPLLCCHVLGMIIDAFRADHVLWGTDSIWWGSPQWQIEALRRLQMPDALMKQFGYKPLSTEVKRQIFGLNAARVYGIDVKAKRNPVPGDYIDQLKKLYKQAGNPVPSNTQYGWVAAV